MAGGALDIGELSGRIEFEDKTSASLDVLVKKVDQLDEKFGHMGHTVAESAAGFFTAEAAMEAVHKAGELVAETLKELTIEGARVADVEENFKHLTSEANILGDTLLQKLREGTHNTISDFDLMKQVNADFAAGLRLSTDQAALLSKGAFALAQATGGDVASAFEKLNDAMLTGRVRGVQMLTGRLDLQAAEEKFAASLGTTADMLTAEGKLESTRVAILEAVGKATDRLGEQTDGLDERVDQAATAWANYKEELGKAIATSPHVTAAFDAIRDALVRAFGGDTEALTDRIVDWVNFFADQVAEYGPKVIQFFVDVKDWIGNLYDSVVSTWDALPDWLKTAAEYAGEAAVGFYAINTAAQVATGVLGGVLGVAGDLGRALSGMPFLLSAVSTGVAGLKVVWDTLDFSSLSQAGASITLLGEGVVGLIGPLGVAAAYAAALYAAFQIGKWQPVYDFFEDLGLRIQGYSEAEREAMIATDHATTAAQANAQAEKAQRDMADQLEKVTSAVKEATDKAKESHDANTAAMDKSRFVMAQTKDEAKAVADAWKEIYAAGVTAEETVAHLDAGLVKAVKGYLDAGVSLDKLKVAYQLTDTEANAIKKTWDDHNDLLKEQKKRLDEVSEAMGRLNELGQDQDQLLRGVGSTVQTEIGHYLTLGATVKDLSLAYGLTEAQIRAIQGTLVDGQAAWKAEQDQLAKTSDLVRTLSGDYVSLDQYRQMQHQGGQFQVTSQNFRESLTDVMTSYGWNPTAMGSNIDIMKAYDYAQKGYSFQEILDIFANAKRGATGKVPPPQGPRIPGFREGGYADFKEGTLAMLHGPEMIVPLDRMGGMGEVNLTFYVNGTAEDTARKIETTIMQRLKMARQFGAA